MQGLGVAKPKVNMLSATNGPQIGIYSFDYGTSWPTDTNLQESS